MNVLKCTGCEEPLARDALSCPVCGQPIEPDATKKLGPIVSLVGALFITVGPFLPWLVFGMESSSGLEETKKRALIFVGLGVFAAMFALSALTGKKFTGLRGNITVGIVAVALAVFFFIQLETLVHEGPSGPHLAKGIYFCVVGSAVVLVGGLLTRSPRSKI